jgi:hypothetical protein
MYVSMNPQVQAALGDALQPGQPSNDSGIPGKAPDHVDFEYTITGPKGAGKVHVVADREGDGWNFTTHTVTIESTGEVINVPIQAGFPPMQPPME